MAVGERHCLGAKGVSVAAPPTSCQPHCPGGRRGRPSRTPSQPQVLRPHTLPKPTAAQALNRAELNSAKGAMYDELRLKAERSEAENQRLLVVEATFRRFEQHANEADKTHRQKEHSLEMLQMDKAYLSKQVGWGRWT